MWHDYYKIMQKKQLNIGIILYPCHCYVCVSEATAVLAHKGWIVNNIVDIVL